MAKNVKRVRIYSPSARATQSGLAREGQWVLEYEPKSPRFTDNLTGWTGSSDMDSQIQLHFGTLAQAEAYARAHGLQYDVAPMPRREGSHKAYSDNFDRKRRLPWTH